MQQPTLLKEDFKIRYGIPLKVSRNQYIECLSGELIGACSGKIINGDHYLTLKNSRFKFMIELTLNLNQ